MVLFSWEKPSHSCHPALSPRLLATLAMVLSLVYACILSPVTHSALPRGLPDLQAAAFRFWPA